MTAVALRRQRSYNTTAVSSETGTDFTGPEGKDMARQEFKEEADINILLKRFGVNAPQKQNPLFNEIDYDLNLQMALSAIETVKGVWKELPLDVKEQYTTWQGMINAAATGQLEEAMAKSLQKRNKKELDEKPPVSDTKAP